MLVLARKVNESLMLGDDIEIVVVEIKGDQVKLGIKAPRSVQVHRKEIYMEIRAENIKAASSQASSLAEIESRLRKKDKGSGHKKNRSPE